MLKKIVSWSLIMCLTIITLLLPGRTVNFAWQSVYAAEQSENDPAMDDKQRYSWLQLSCL